MEDGFNAFEPFGLWEFGGEPIAQRIYEGFKKNMGAAFHGQPGDDNDTDLFCTSIQFAIVQQIQTQSALEVLPSRMYQTLRTNERDLGIIPRKGQSLADRRATVAAGLLIPRGGTRINLNQILTAALGNEYVGIFVQPWADATMVPADEETGIQYRRSSEPFSIVRIVDPVSIGGEETVEYEIVSGVRLRAGDMLLVEGEDRPRAEVVEVLATTSSGGVRTLTADFTSPHDPATMATTGPYPMIQTSKRHIYVMLTDAAIDDPELVRIAHRVMARTVRGVTTWSVCVENTPGSGISGPYTYTSPFGLTPMEEITVN